MNPRLCHSALLANKNITYDDFEQKRIRSDKLLLYLLNLLTVPDDKVAFRLIKLSDDKALPTFSIIYSLNLHITHTPVVCNQPGSGEKSGTNRAGKNPKPG